MTKRLPFSTADCDESPQINFVLGRLQMIFDYRWESAKQYAEIVFDGAICMKFTADPFVSEEMVAAYSKVCEYDSSDWLKRLKERSEHEFNQELKHFRVYFDHYGCIDVIAKSWALENPIKCTSSSRSTNK